MVQNPVGHLQIIYDDGSGNLVETEVQAPKDVGILGGNWDFVFGEAHNANPPGEKYGMYELPLSEGQSAENVWELIKQVHVSLFASSAVYDIDYDTLAAPPQNSNSYVRTLLDVIGNFIDWGNAFENDGLSTFPGYGRNILENLTTIADNGVPLTVAGTAGNDIVNGGNNNDDLGGKCA